MWLAVYRLGWCILVPTILLGGLLTLLDQFRPATPLTSRSWQAHLLWQPLAFPLLFMFLSRLRNANPAILLASVALGVIIGVTEEVLWRGVYLRLFPGDLWLGLIHPSVMLGV